MAQPFGDYIRLDRLDLSLRRSEIFVEHGCTFMSFEASSGFTLL